MKVLILTYGNQPIGVVESYITSNCNYFNDQLGYDVKYIAFVSIRNYFSYRKKLKSLYKNTYCLPCLLGFSRWFFNIVYFFLFPWIFKADVVWSVSPIATNLAIFLRKLKLTKKVVFDSEGSPTAEWFEFDVLPNSKLKNNIYKLELKAINESDRQRVVSNSMLNYWREDFKFKGNTVKVIPCVLSDNNSSEHFDFDIQLYEQTFREKYNGELVLIYIGNDGPWQPISEIEKLILPLLENYRFLRVILLTNSSIKDTKLYARNSSKIFFTHANKREVLNFLKIAHIGLILRVKSKSSMVSSPIKFAEYLNASLHVIISEDVGDYSKLVEKHKLGIVINNNTEEVNSYFERIVENPLVSNYKNRRSKLMSEKFYRNKFINEFKFLIED